MERMRTFILLCFITAFNSLAAQYYAYGVEAEPRPYLLKPYFPDLITRPVKKVTFIYIFNADNSRRNDTMNVYEYDRQGRKTKQVSYERNSISYIYTYRYNGMQVAGWQEERFGNSPGSYRYILTNHYNKAGKIEWEEGINIVNGDTIQRINVYFEYDADGNLLSKKNYHDKRWTFRIDYGYENGKLVTYRSYTSPADLPRNYMALDYTYKEGKLTYKKNFSVRDTATDFLGEHFYYYENDRLSKETYHYPGYSTTKKGPVQVMYTWQDSSLAAMHITQDTFYRKVKYTRSNGRIDEVNVETNTGKVMGNEFTMLLPLTAYAKEKIFNYRENNTYDAYGSIVQKDIYLDGTLIKQVKYVFEYY